MELITHFTLRNAIVEVCVVLRVENAKMDQAQADGSISCTGTRVLGYR